MVHNPEMDASILTRDQIALITPEILPTRTFRPIPHIDLIKTVERSVERRGFQITREEFAIGKKGAVIFGIMELAGVGNSIEGVTAALGLRAANDRSMSVQVTVGMRVFVCDNLAFSSNGIALKKKHAAGLQLDRVMIQAVDTFAGRYLTMEKQVEHLQNDSITDTFAKALMFEAFEKKMLPLRLLPMIAQHYWEPQHEEFKPRTMWSLHNAFTEGLKEMDPIPAHRANMKISKLFQLTSTEGVH